MSYMNEVNGRGSTDKKMPRRSSYPQVGVCPVREPVNAGKYRGGTFEFADRYIIPPIGDGLLAIGMTVADLLVAAGAVAFLMLMAWLCGLGFDGYLDSMGL